MRSLINKVTARLSAKTPARRAPRLDPRPLSRPATGQVTRQATRQSSRPAEGSGTKRPLRDLETTALLARRLPEDRVLPRPIRKAVSSRRMLLLAIAIAAPYLAMRGMAMAEGALDASRQTADQQLVAGEARETGFWAWLSSTGDVARQAIPTAADTGLVVNHITVTGRDRTTPSELLSALGTKRGAPILKVDPQDARARLMDLPWIAEATVERRLPDRIHVALVERQPLALWRHDGQFTVIDRQGDPIAVDPALFADLIILVGAKAPMEAEDLLATLGEIPEIAERVKAASLVSGRRWTLRIDSLRDGLDIHLPETGAPGALKLISRMHREDGLLDKDLSSVDLREPGRMVVSLTERAESLENLDALEAPESDEGGQTAPVPSEEADASASLEGRDA